MGLSGVGASLGLGFSKGSSSSNTVLNSKTTNQGTSQQNEQTQQRVTKFDRRTKKILNAFTEYLSSQAMDEEGAFTKEQAVADANGLVTSIFNKYAQETLPQIYSAGQSSGVFNSTVQQNMANDAYSQAVADAASAVVQNISNYAKISTTKRGQELNALIQAFNVQKGAVTQATGSTDTTGQFQNTSETQATKSSSSSASSIGVNAGIGASFS